MKKIGPVIFVLLLQSKHNCIQNNISCGVNIGGFYCKSTTNSNTREWGQFSNTENSPKDHCNNQLYCSHRYGNELMYS